MNGRLSFQMRNNTLSMVHLPWDRLMNGVFGGVGGTMFSANSKSLRRKTCASRFLHANIE
jgi:hypothetical protein